MGNRTFFKQVEAGEMTLGDIFAEVGKRHSPQETAKVLISGTELTTPAEAEMLSGWQKPFLFARFFAGYGLVLVLTYLLGKILEYNGAYFLLMAGIPFLVPVTFLLLVWEMNIPRNISLYEVLAIVGIGGILSIIAAVVGFRFDESESAIWAGIVEEPAKLLVIYCILKRKDYPYTLNGVLIGVAVGTGFAVMESLVYIWNYFYMGVLTGVDVFLEGEYGSSIILAMGVGMGMRTALVRAFTALSGHGVFAGLYGGALAKVKGREPIQIGHLLKPDFLIYFAISILLHALHNSGLDLGLPALFDGMLRGEYIIIAAVAVALLLISLRAGVNQVVRICLKQNGGRVTQAVNREAGAAYVPSGGQLFALEAATGPLAGRVFPLQPGRPVTLGRSGSSDICLAGCDSVSGTHCRIVANESGVTVTDLGSTNGTYLGSQRLAPQKPAAAGTGVMICLGSKNCAFRLRVR